MHPDEKLEPEVETVRGAAPRVCLGGPSRPHRWRLCYRVPCVQLLLDMADHFVEDVVRFGIELAKHRKSNKLEERDVLLHLGERATHTHARTHARRADSHLTLSAVSSRAEKSWNIKINGSSGAAPGRVARTG
jgi:hypothetical protein